MLYRQELCAASRRATWRSSAPRRAPHHDHLPPDREIFEETEFSASTLAQRLRETAFLTRALRIVLRDERPGGTMQEFHYEAASATSSSYINESKGAGAQARRLLRGRERAGCGRGRDAVEHLVRRSVFTFANNINTTEGRLAPLPASSGADGDPEQVTRATRAS